QCGEDRQLRSSRLDRAWHCCLLCAREGAPCERAAKQREQLASSHGLPQFEDSHPTTSVWKCCVLHHGKIDCRMAEVGQKRRFRLVSRKPAPPPKRGPKRPFPTRRFVRPATPKVGFGA